MDPTGRCILINLWNVQRHENCIDRFDAVTVPVAAFYYPDLLAASTHGGLFSSFKIKSTVTFKLSRVSIQLHHVWPFSSSCLVFHVQFLCPLHSLTTWSILIISSSTHPWSSTTWCAQVGVSWVGTAPVQFLGVSAIFGGKNEGWN